MDVFIHPDLMPAQNRLAEPGGAGPFFFRRLMDASQFASAFDFVDFTVVPAGSSIGKHFHQRNEELYFVISGAPLINVNGCERRVGPGSLAVVRSGEWHSLTNDTLESVTILVVQAQLDESFEH